MRVPHIALQFHDSVENYGDRIATREPEGDSWRSLTYRELDQVIERAARGFIEQGVAVGDRVAIFSHNRVAWTVADYALLRIGAVPTPIYPTSTSEQIDYILRDCAAVGIIVEGAAEYARVAPIRSALPLLSFVLSFDPIDATDVIEWVDFGSIKEATGTEVARRLAQVSGDDLATIIYTSGTTGSPKGVMLQHKAFIAEMSSLDVVYDIGCEDHSLSILPLSHSLERAWTFWIMSHGCMNTYCTDPKSVIEMFGRVRPTIFACVPRLYEKIRAGVEEKVSDSPKKKKIFEWALRVGGQAQHAYRKGKSPALWWRLQLPLADFLVLRSIREVVGGPKTLMISGGAPLRLDVEEFFSAAGLLIIQGYGMTEAAPLITFNGPTAFKMGSVGQVMSGGEIRIGMDSEILYRGENVMAGYWNNPEATAESIDEDGWLHTGDAGYIDENGFLTITDRLKDILVTSGGKNIAPQPIEGMLLADPLFEQAVLLGNDRPFVTLLVTPSMAHLEDLARSLQVSWANREELLANPRIMEEMKSRIAALTAKLPSHEQVKDVRVLMEEFTLENGLLTPTLKVKRKEVEKRFSEVIEDMYTKLAALRRKGE
ncbi:MAG: AMP-dependent synthetase/ligase [Propionibacteriaceae bacterium]